MESARHFKGKIALHKILLEDNYTIWDYEYALPNMDTDLGFRDFTADIFAEKDGQFYCFEVDGKKGHSTKLDLFKMKIRDLAFLKCGVITVRLCLDDLVGAKKQPVEILLKEIEYQSRGMLTG